MWTRDELRTIVDNLNATGIWFCQSNGKNWMPINDTDQVLALGWAQVGMAPRVVSPTIELWDYDYLEEAEAK